MAEPEITLEMIAHKLEQVHQDVLAMRAEYDSIVALLRSLNLDPSDPPRRVH